MAGGAYVPQIAHLVRAHCISRLAFGVWLVSSLLITTSAVATRASVFIFLSAIQIVATTLIYFYARVYKNSYCEIHFPLVLASERPPQGERPSASS